MVMVEDLNKNSADNSMSAVISQLYQVKSGYETMVNTLIRQVKQMEKTTPPPFAAKPTTERYSAEEGDQYHKLSTREKRDVPLSASTQSRKELIGPGTGEANIRCKHCKGYGYAISSQGSNSDKNRMRSPSDGSGFGVNIDHSKINAMHANIGQLQRSKRDLQTQLNVNIEALAAAEKGLERSQDQIRQQ